MDPTTFFDSCGSLLVSCVSAVPLPLFAWVKCRCPNPPCVLGILLFIAMSDIADSVMGTVCVVAPATGCPGNDGIIITSVSVRSGE